MTAGGAARGTIVLDLLEGEAVAKKTPKTLRRGTSIRLGTHDIKRADALAAAALKDPVLAKELGVDGAPLPDRSAILRRAITIGLDALGAIAAK